MKYTRVRVAISPLYSCPSKPVPATSNRRCIHIGHARTLLLGSLIAKEVNSPFHVRFDGPPYEQGGGEVGDRGEAILDLQECLAFLQIKADLIYWIPPAMPNDGWLRDRLGSRFEVFRKIIATAGFAPAYYQAVLCDDVLVHAPSLIVRGLEFVSQEGYFANLDAAGGASHIAAEDALYAVAGEKKHEVNVPMVIVDHAKMSKTLVNGIHWTALTATSGEAARSFLTATALNAQDPLSMLGYSFLMEKMDKRPYAWSWPLWGRFLRI